MNGDEFIHAHSKVNPSSIQDIYLVVWLLKKASHPHVSTKATTQIYLPSSMIAEHEKGSKNKKKSQHFQNVKPRPFLMGREGNEAAWVRFAQNSVGWLLYNSSHEKKSEKNENMSKGEKKN